MKTQTAQPVHKISLGCFPTPLQELTRMETLLGDGKRLFLKRDDLCGIGFGGNKIRKLEYILGDALQQGCDAIVTCGGSQSNQPLAVAACANKAGLAAYLVLPQSTNPLIQSFLSLLGASVYLTESGDTGELGRTMRRVQDALRQKGHAPYLISQGAVSLGGTLGYVAAMKELFEQARAARFPIQHVLVCGASGNTYAGVALGTKMFSPSTRATVISIAGRFTHKTTLCRMANEAAEKLDTDVRLTEDDLSVHFSCGRGAGAETLKGREAVQLMAQKEGIFLDPLFTGKAFAGLLDLNQQGYFQPGDGIVFIHTGGMGTLISKL